MQATPQAAPPVAGPGALAQPGVAPKSPDTPVLGPSPPPLAPVRSVGARADVLGTPGATATCQQVGNCKGVDCQSGRPVVLPASQWCAPARWRLPASSRVLLASRAVKCGGVTETHAPARLIIMHSDFINGFNPGSLLTACWQTGGVIRHSSTGDEAPAAASLSNKPQAAEEYPAPLRELLKRVAVTARVALLASPVRVSRTVVVAWTLRRCSCT